MTDAISKEIKIEEDAVLIMKLGHVNYPLVCKSHNCKDYKEKPHQIIWILSWC